MVHDSSVTSRRLADLCFNDMAALKAASDLVPRQKQLIERLASVKAFPHVERLFDEATLKQREGDEEQTYQLLSRMGVISQIIIRKNDFTQFKSTPDGRRFYDLFKICISRLSELEESLRKRYDLKEVEKAYRAKDMQLSEIATNGVDKGNSQIEFEFDLAIGPRELVHFVEGKRQALIIDYRDDQTTMIKYENIDRILVAHVPAEAIVPGCIGTSLIRSAAVSERALLQRMSDVDLVVLLGSECAPRSKDSLRPSSKEHILFNALSTYNTTFRLRRPPVFLDGGFKNWRLHYPMHTSDIHAAKRISFNINDQSEFARAVAEYKKDICIQSLQYPDLLRREKPAAPQQTPIVPPEIPVSDAPVMYPSVTVEAPVAPPAAAPPPPAGPSLHQPDITSPKVAPEPPSLPENDERIGRVTSTQPSISEGGTIPEVKRGEAQGAAAKSDSTPPPSKSEVCPPGTTRPVESQNVPSETLEAEQSTPSSTRPVIPAVDRSKKPVLRAPEIRKDEKRINSDSAHLQRSYNSSPNIEAALPQVRTLGGARIDQSYPTSAISTRPVIPDRSIKPHIASSDDVKGLLILYDSMTKSIASGSTSRRVNPGYTGLYNLGNTCFMNSTLQALFNTHSLRCVFTRRRFAELVNQRNKMGTFGVISAAFSALMDAVWSGAYSAIRPLQFLETFASEVNASLADRRQHDAQEFQIYLLDALHEDMNRVHRPVSFEQNYTGMNLFEEGADYEAKSKMFSSSPVNDIFGCQTVSQLQCGTCQAQSVTFEEVTQLSVELPTRGASTIIDCIKAHFKPVVLDGSCKWHCPKCKALRVATRVTRIWKLPKVLVVHLKRFSFVVDGWEKNDALIHFDCLPLDVSSVVHPLIREKASPRSECFNLYAVTNHSGRLNSGHYTSVMHNEDTKEWLFYDDESVTPINADSICSKNAYILYFKKANL
uniref:Ubiquitin carboxyl-terminal hydrolase n=1 Tax=Ascaris suum TaxID=6253 RepID=F1KUZ2_ASCSU